MDTLRFFTHDNYQRHNRRRQEHLASLGLPIHDRSVLELGAGIGDHTSFFLDRGCRVTVTDAREENLQHVRVRFPAVTVRQVDLERSLPVDLPTHDVVYAYGVLYHLGDPGAALARMAAKTGEVLLLETCVSFGSHEAINPLSEDANDLAQAAHGTGCRPTRPWVFHALRSLFPHVHVPLTQPWHEEFPVDWKAPAPANTTGLYRSVFVASRNPLNNALLADRLLEVQERR